MYCEREITKDRRVLACPRCRELRDQGCDFCHGPVNRKGLIFSSTGEYRANISPEGHYLGQLPPTGPPCVLCEACAYTPLEVRQREVYGCATMDLIQQQVRQRAADYETGSELLMRKWEAYDAQWEAEATPLPPPPPLPLSRRGRLKERLKTGDWASSWDGSRYVTPPARPDEAPHG